MVNSSAQSAIQNLLDQLVAKGRERGLQVAAYRNGELVVNAWAGVADAASGRPVDEHTLFPVFSVTKGIAATVLHQVVSRAQVSYDTPIAEFWPEFAAHGKGGTTLRHALTHSAGIPQMPRPLDYATLGDWNAMCAAIADLTPLWVAGTRIEYHAITYGWLVGEVARRIDGRPFLQLLAEEIAHPLGLDDLLYVGIPDSAEPRVATLEEPGSVWIPDDGRPQSIPAWLGPLHAFMNRPDARRACLPASSGIATAHALARHYAALLPGGVDGVELLVPQRVALATERQTLAHPESDDYPRNWGLGYALGTPDSTYGFTTAFGHEGYGGAIGFADPASGLAVGITKNLFNSEGTPRRIVEELRRTLLADGTQ